MKLNKTQIRRLIAEERAKLTEQGGEALISETPTDLENDMAMTMQELFEDSIAAETYDGTGPSWQDEISRAGFDYHQAIIDSGAAKMMLELFNDIEERLHNGDYA
jgi:hypothetical protein